MPLELVLLSRPFELDHDEKRVGDVSQFWLYFKMEKGRKKDPKYYHPACDPVTSPSEFFVHFK